MNNEAKKLINYEANDEMNDEA